MDGTRKGQGQAQIVVERQVKYGRQIITSSYMYIRKLPLPE